MLPPRDQKGNLHCNTSPSSVSSNYTVSMFSPRMSEDKHKLPYNQAVTLSICVFLFGSVRAWYRESVSSSVHQH